MLVHLKQGQVVKLTMLVLAALAVLYTGFALNSKKVDAAGPPYDILYSNTSDYSSAQPLEGTTVTDDIYVFVDDSDLQASSTWWWEGSSFSRIDTSRSSANQSYELKGGGRYYFSDLGWAGENAVKAKPITATNEPQTVSTYNVPYGQKYHGDTLSFKSTSIVGSDSVYVVAGNKGSGSNIDWSIEKRSARTVGGSAEWSRTFSIGAAADELYDLTTTDGSNPDLFAVGSYQDVTDIKPVVKARRWTDGGSIWTEKDLWGAGVTGAVTSVIASVYNSSGGNERRVWVVGYEGGGAADPYWAMKKLDADNGDLITGGAWDQPVRNELGNTIKGEALEVAKDLNYIYIGGYVEDASGDPYWRLEKRNRTDGALVDEVELPGVRGKIEALGVQITQGTDAVWAGGYEDTGAGPEWRFQKFTFDGGGLFVPGVSKTWNNGSITEINLEGLDHVYVGGNQIVSGADMKWIVEAYGRDGVQKVGGEGTLLDEDLSTGADTLSAMDLPYVVGWNGDTGAGFVRGVKPRADEIVCTDVIPSLTLEERYIIDHKYRGHLGASHNDDMSSPIEKARGIDLPIPQSPIIPPGKYDIIQVAADRDHLGEVDNVQLHEEFVTYFFGTNPANFAKTTQTDDIPNDWLYTSSVHTGLEIPFYISSTTIAHYIYDQSPGTWDNKGILSYPGVPNHGGSLDPICTVLDRYPQCSDGIDNDFDGVIDMGDAGCTDANDDDENNAPVTPNTCTLVQGTDMAAGEYEIVIPLSGWLGSDAGPPSVGPFTVDKEGNPLNIAPGQYTATLESSDGYVGRSSDPQAYESWKAVFSNSGTVVDTSAASDDLADGESAVNLTYTNSELASNAAPLNFTSAVNEVSAEHAYMGQAGLNDVKPVCVGLNPVPMCTLVQGTGDDEYDVVVNFSPSSYTDNTIAANTLVGPANLTHPNNPFPISLTSGHYDITLEGYDSAPGRGVDTNEFWRIDLRRTDNGNVLSSFTTPDLIDNVDFVRQIYKAPTPLNIPSNNYNQISVLHGDVSVGNAGSVNALCAGFKKTAPIGQACTLTGDYVVYLAGDDVGATSVGFIRSDRANRGATTTLSSGNIPPGGMTPGDYVVTLQSYDDHQPSDAIQPNETWKAELFASNGITKLLETGVSDDLPNDVSVNETVVNNLLTIPAGVTQLRAIHGAWYNNSSTNSLYPVCAAFSSTIRPNLVPNVGPVTPSPTFNLSTGAYDNISVTYLIENTGGYAAGAFKNYIDLTYNGGTVATFEEDIAGLSANSDTGSRQTTLGANVMPGDYTLYFKTDSADTVFESNEADNEVTVYSPGGTPPSGPNPGPGVITVPIPAPDPGIELTTTPGFVRSGKQVELAWDTKATYDMSCVLSGQGSNNLASFNPMNDGATGTFLTNAIKSKSVYTLDCTENISGTSEVFTTTTTIEVVPASQEL